MAENVSARKSFSCLFFSTLPDKKYPRLKEISTTAIALLVDIELAPEIVSSDLMTSISRARAIKPIVKLTNSSFL